MVFRSIISTCYNINIQKIAAYPSSKKTTFIYDTENTRVQLKREGVIHTSGESPHNYELRIMNFIQPPPR